MENFRIESLEINKIGAFEHIKMDFPVKKDEYAHLAEIHILTGENGTGKSTILEALVNIGLDIPDDNKLIIFNKNTGLLEEGFINIKTSHNYFYKLWKIKEVHANPIPQGLIDLIRYDKPLSLGMFAYSGYRRTQDVKISGIKEINESPLENSLNFDKSIKAENLQQWIFNLDYRMLSALRAKDEMASKNIYKHITLIEAILTQIIGENILLEVSPESFKLNVILSLNTNKQEIIPFENLPDGLKSMISWIGDLLMRMDRLKWKDDLPIFERNFILFLDEIEVHLHPAWQRKILPVVQKLFKNAQIFISTHSPFVVGSVDGAWVHKLKKDGAYAVLDGKPELSSDGKTFVQILSDTFDITSLFGEQNERKILKFKELKGLILSGQDYDETEFNILIDELSKESRALENLVGIEIRQINKTLGIDILATHATI